MEELEIIRHRQIDGISIFFDTVDYRTPHFHQEWELIWITQGRLSVRLGPEGAVAVADCRRDHVGDGHRRVVADRQRLRLVARVEDVQRFMESVTRD